MKILSLKHILKAAYRTVATSTSLRFTGSDADRIRRAEAISHEAGRVEILKMLRER